MKKREDYRPQIVHEIDILFAEWIGNHGVDALPSQTFPRLFKLLEALRD